MPKLTHQNKYVNILLTVECDIIKEVIKSIRPDLPNHEEALLNHLMQLQKKDMGLKGHLQPVSNMKGLSDSMVVIYYAFIQYIRQ